MYNQLLIIENLTWEKNEMMKQNVSQCTLLLASAGQCSHLFFENVDKESLQVDGSWEG
jgi:hypothetical protein